VSVGRRSPAPTLIPARTRVRTSWDDHAISIEPPHRLSQGHLIKTGKPKSIQGGMPSQLRKAAAQVEGVFEISCFQTPPPATDGMPAGPVPPTHRSNGMPCQQQQKCRLLKGPWIPAPWSDTGWEPGAGPPAMRAIEAGNGDRVLVLAIRPNPVCLPPIMPVEPDTRLAAVWTTTRPIGLWFQIKALKVLLQGRDPWQDTGHRLVSFGLMVRLVAYHDSRG